MGRGIVCARCSPSSRAPCRQSRMITVRRGPDLDAGRVCRRSGRSPAGRGDRATRAPETNVHSEYSYHERAPRAAPPLPSAGPLIRTARDRSHFRRSRRTSWEATASRLVLDRPRQDQGGEYGQTDREETFDDANAARHPRPGARGVDIVCDGEMRRFFFVQTFYGRWTASTRSSRSARPGLYAYDSTPRYRPRQRIKVPNGSASSRSSGYLKTQNDRPVKATCPAPSRSRSTSSSAGDVYGQRPLALCWDFVPPSTPS